MKNRFLLLVAFLVFGSNYAQDANTTVNKIKFGLKGGMNISNITGDTDTSLFDEFVPRISFNIGAFAIFKLSEQFAVQPELLFSKQGTEIDIEKSLYGSGFYVTGYDKINLSYLNIPIIGKFYPVNNLSIEFGPQIGFLLSAKEKYSIEDELNLFGSGNDDIKDDFETIDFGLDFGLGYEIIKQINVDLRYYLGVTNISNNEAGDDTKIHNSVFSISVGYTFD